MSKLIIDTIYVIGFSNDKEGKFPFPVIKISTLLLIVLSSILLNSCTTRYYPQATDRISVVDNYALIEVENIAFAISARTWTRDPQRLSDFFTTYHVIVKNQSLQTITISPSDIILLDQETNQYDAITVSEVSEILFYDDFLLDKFSPFPDRTDTFTGDRLASRVSFMQEAFHYGDILPGARKSGFIFFRKLPARNQQSTVIFKGEEIVFIRR
ncbi:MAG: hypothetical protein K0B81_00495 [Candidatus Cloacimonetes bacterium]|nr:hypothetical protein [Candidatus Cloacimonadota bacterium]